MGRITIKEVAARCNVGVSTVSRALNNHPDINEETREKIMKVIKETGFIPNNSARNLKMRESNSIGLLVKGIYNTFFGDMIRIISEAAQKKGYSLILRHIDKDEDEVDAALALVLEQKLKGIVFLGGNFTHDSKKLKKLGIPFVFSTIGKDVEGRNDSGKLTYSNVAVDDEKAGFEAVEYLINEGHRNIAIVTEDLSEPSVGMLRYRGYCRALEKHGIKVQSRLVYEIGGFGDHYTMANGYAAGQKLFGENRDITGIFCIADVLAIGVCRAAAEMGITIPGELSVMGFDGIEMTEYYNPKLTTVAQPIERMAQVTAAHLFDLIDGTSEPQDIVMPAELVIRESTGPCNS